jgi:hypothetical protein
VAAPERAVSEVAANTPAEKVVEAVSAAPEPSAEEPAPAPDEPATALKKEPQKLMSSGSEPAEGEGSEIDRVLLAKEFSGLLQLDSDGDEGSS